MERGTAGQLAVEMLRAHLPFSRMKEDALQEIASHLSETFFAEGEPVFSPTDGAPTHLLIVKQGRIRHPEVPIAEGATRDVWDLSAGDCFPIRALLEDRPVIVPYRAAEDTFCYLLPAAVFHRLLEISPEFLAFCSQRLRELVLAASDAARTATARSLVEQVPLTTHLGDLVRRAPVVCAPDTPLSEVFEVMTRERVGSIVAVDADFRPRGVFTLRDVLPRFVLPRLGMDVPVSKVMTSPARALPEDTPAWHAALEMSRNGMAHLCVVQGERLVGVVSERDLFPMQRVRLVPLTRAIVEAPDLPTLEAAVRGIDPLVDHMLAQGLSAVPLIEIVTTLNDHTTRRVIALCVEEYVAAHGPLPCDFTWLSFGSEGRREQTLKTDQDNGMVLHLAPGQTAEAARAELLPLARSINAALEACGFPRCPGNIMAGNPECCLSLDEWRTRFMRWVDQGTPEFLLQAAIFFDLRALHGSDAPVVELRDWLAERVPQNQRFLHQMTENALRNRPPLSWWDNIVVDRGGKHPNTIDLKMHGTTPFVDGARVYALARGIRETNTARRLQAVAQRGLLPEDEVESWSDAWTYLQSLRMQMHQEQASRHVPRTNRINPDTLNPLEQRLLKEVLRQARHLQTRLALDFGA